ncbi:hypothetical protein HNY73_022818 [Argiope bruennichi]|uniref:Uncharacterized protein n=1 Tax=Argiope bruennichi TaxID=94029 RepID=A0A8T0E248_ARGBR|nr:hypothetical protein HNY73_022818 [Argiope bruennichi]
MFPLPDFLFLRHIDFLLIGTAVTALQKFVFVLYFAASLWNGTFYDTCDRFLMPNRPGRKWMSFFHKEMQDCDSLFRIFTKQQCINSIFLKDDKNVYFSAVNLSKFSKWHYLIIVRTFKFLAPIIIQLTFFLLPVFAAMLQMAFVRKILGYLGYEGLWRRAGQGLQHLSTRAGLRRSKLKSFLCLVFGFLAASSIVCFCTTSPSDLLKECKTPVCLYCYPRLMHTIFKEKVGKDINQKAVQIMFAYTKYFNTAIFSSLLYASTVVVCCMLIYIVTDACLSIWETARTALLYLSNMPVKETALETWNQYFIPLRDTLPSPRRSESNLSF